MIDRAQDFEKVSERVRQERNHPRSLPVERQFHQESTAPPRKPPAFSPRAQAMIDEFDKDGDGMINNEEFAYILKQTSL